MRDASLPIARPEGSGASWEQVGLAASTGSVAAELRAGAFAPTPCTERHVRRGTHRRNSPATESQLRLPFRVGDSCVARTPWMRISQLGPVGRRRGRPRVGIEDAYGNSEPSASASLRSTIFMRRLMNWGGYMILVARGSTRSQRPCQMRLLVKECRQGRRALVLSIQRLGHVAGARRPLCACSGTFPPLAVEDPRVVQDGGPSQRHEARKSRPTNPYAFRRDTDRFAEPCLSRGWLCRFPTQWDMQLHRVGEESVGDAVVATLRPSESPVAPQSSPLRSDTLAAHEGALAVGRKSLASAGAPATSRMLFGRRARLLGPIERERQPLQEAGWLIRIFVSPLTARRAVQRHSARFRRI